MLKRSKTFDAIANLRGVVAGVLKSAASRLTGAWQSTHARTTVALPNEDAHATGFASWPSAAIGVLVAGGEWHTFSHSNTLMVDGHIWLDEIISGVSSFICLVGVDHGRIHNLQSIQKAEILFG